MSDAAMKSAEDMVAEADTGARHVRGFSAKLIFWICILWSVFQLYIASKVPGVIAQATGINDFANIVAQARYIHLAFALTLATLAFPILGHRNRIPWYDWALVVLGISACLYLVIFRFEIADRPGLWTSADIIMSGIGMAVLLIAVFRSLGLPLVIIASLFLCLAFFGGYSEWVGSITNYGGASFKKAMGHYWMQTEGVFGVALGVSTTMIFLFVLFGALFTFMFEINAPNANITSFGDAVWWGFVTVTTVGYGDFTPITVGGRVIAVGIMFTGAAAVGAVTAAVASRFINGNRDEPAKPEPKESQESHPAQKSQLSPDAQNAPAPQTVSSAPSDHELLEQISALRNSVEALGRQLAGRDARAPGE